MELEEAAKLEERAAELEGEAGEVEGRRTAEVGLLLSIVSGRILTFVERIRAYSLSFAP